MLERKLGDNYTLTVDEMAGVYDMLEESHFPASVTFTFLAEWFESVSCFDTAEKIRNLLDTYLEDENELLKHISCKLIDEWLSRIPGGPIPEDFILKEQEKARKRVKEEGENDKP